MTTIQDTVLPPQTDVGFIGWVKNNLMNSWYNSLFTILMLVIGVFFLQMILRWSFFSADWSAVTSNLKLYMVGQYPQEELWRVGVVLFVVTSLLGVTWGLWGGVARTFALAVIGAAALIAILPLSLDDLAIEGRVWILASAGFVAAGHYFVRVSGSVATPKRVIWAWIASFFLGMFILRGFEGVPLLPVVGTNQWGGLLLTFTLALVGIVASFPLGMLLALGRRSNLPIVSLFSILFIELIRGVPLITLLFMTQIILPLLLPDSLPFLPDRLLNILDDRIVRAFLAITLFSAAYMAENIRGGLQAVSISQVEAAKALGLSGRHTMAFIVMPQALKAVIPAIVGQFIALFKDTTLVVIVGLLDIVGIGKAIVLGNVEWVDAQREVYLFIAAMFWVFTFAMSYASRKLEESLGIKRH
jgi:general L-amino acid transport system permease protein